jgi:hypothetical protein
VAVLERDRDASRSEVGESGDGIGREARFSLFAVGDDGRACLLEAADRVRDGGLVERLQSVCPDAPGAERADAFDQLLGTWNTSDRLGG